RDGARRRSGGPCPTHRRERRRLSPLCRRHRCSRRGHGDPPSLREETRPDPDTVTLESLRPVELLAEDHAVDEFDCGVAEPERWWSTPPTTKRWLSMNTSTSTSSRVAASGDGSETSPEPLGSSRETRPDP